MAGRWRGAGRWQSLPIMSEPPPPPYITRTFVCRTCRKVYQPPPAEAEALAELERAFGLPPEHASGECEECAGRQVQ